MNGSPVATPRIDELRCRLQAAGHDIGVRRVGLRLRGDHDLNPGLQPRLPLIPAAVLVPIVARAAGPTILLTRRTEHLADHPGQISFPGGRLDPGDADAVAAALRETAEEVGLARERVEIIGRLDTYQTRTGYEVTPIVGVVLPPFTLALDPHEVAEAFEVPLDFVLDKANHERGSRMYQGVERQFWVLPYRDYYIWGATAGMLVNLQEVLTR
ncbi:MAG: CoA pyrophosphatase [Proteobacteria bacterium]|nr:CoA pyrophosphatase [Pseudomonadota bacterium]